ncbi:hypothetical protein [Aquisphaera giovannonii]|uniref:hypothetical protein n=1 Tax=Aquisphaera giovannonii TaxID=406548 RepID=UPI0011DF46E0|nr:hypothetical protein [Aquisphaera giovannonii]
MEFEFGTALSGDYKWLIDTYGTGHSCDLPVVLNPFAMAEGRNLLAQMKPLLAHNRSSPTYRRPFLHFPEPGGLLAVAQDLNAGSLFWLTAGDAGNWALFHYDGGGRRHQAHPTTLVEFLVAWIGGRSPESFFGVGNSQ